MLLLAAVLVLTGTALGQLQLDEGLIGLFEALWQPYSLNEPILGAAERVDQLGFVSPFEDPCAINTEHILRLDVDASLHLGLWRPCVFGGQQHGQTLDKPSSPNMPPQGSRKTVVVFS